MRTSKFFSDNVILFFALCVVASFLCQIFKVTAPVNILYIVSLLMVLGCYLGSGYVTKMTMLLTMLIALASCINGFRSNTMDYYTHVLITLDIFICIEVSANVKISVDTFRKIAGMFLITAIILLVMYYFGPLKTTYFGYNHDSVCLNFTNPNAAGLWLVCIFILVLYSSFLFKGLWRMLYTVVAFGILPIILATQSRNSFFACIFFIVGLVVTRGFRIKKVPKWILAVLTVLPLLVFAFYMFVVIENKQVWEDVFSITAIDKGIGTRQRIWQKVIDDFGQCFLLGDYYEYYNSQMHNSLLTIFCRFGAPVTALSCVSIYRALRNLQEKSSFYAALSLAAIFFTGCFEASVFVGIAGMYLMLLLIPACASAEQTALSGTQTESEKVNICET